MDEMKPTLVRLNRLQELESALADIEARLRRVPARISERERTLEAALQALQAAKDELQAAAKARRALEQDVEAARDHIRRYQGQLTEVKTNEQYRALSTEIATERKKIEGIEERILLNLERSDELAALVKEKEGWLGQEKGRVEGEKRQLLEEQRQLEAERAERRSERDGVEKELPADVLALFRRIVKTRGTAVSRVEGETCGDCRVRARPQPLAQVRTYERLVQCENCQRILFWAPRPGAEPAPPASAEA